MKKRVALYLRVSTKGQSVENQRRELEAVAAHRGWACRCHLSGRRDQWRERPRQATGVRPASQGRHKTAVRFDRRLVGRSVGPVATGSWSPRSANSTSLGVDLYLHQQAVDTTTPAGKALFQMMGVIAEFEREIIRERINAGLARTRAKGTKLGRRPVAPSVEARIRALRADGMGMLKIGRELGIGTSVVQRVVASLLRKRRQVINL